MFVCKDCGGERVEGRSYCNPCHYKRYQKGKQHARTSRLKMWYGTTPEEVAEAKKVGCAVCGSFGKLVIDHKADPNGKVIHQGKKKSRAGKFRGVLCSNCNLALGLLGED